MDKAVENHLSVSFETPKSVKQALLTAQHNILVVRQPQAPAKIAPGQPGTASSYIPTDPEIFIAIQDDGTVLAFNGHVDLGTGIKTSLGQIVAEELDVSFETVQMMLGHTEAVPNQGPTIASATIQISAIPLRKAAAQARHYLLNLASDLWGVAVDDMSVDHGCISAKNGKLQITYAELVRDHKKILTLDLENVKTKALDQYKIVGKKTQRVDIPGKVLAQQTYVHDMRVPNMLHGRVIRPPYRGRDAGAFISQSLQYVDRASIAHIPGIVEVVIKGDFVGVVAEREEQAQQAAKALKIVWAEIPPLVDMSNAEQMIRSLPVKQRVLIDDVGFDEAFARSKFQLAKTYVWPYQMHASIGPSCSLADYTEDKLTVWSGTQNPHMLRIDLSNLLDMDESMIEIVRMEAAGCYGRNCADDVCTDAALLSYAVKRPVRVQLTREQEHAWEPKGTAQIIDLKAGVGDDGTLMTYDCEVYYPSNDAPTLTLLLTGAIKAEAKILEMGDRTIVSPYNYQLKHIVCNDMAPVVRSSWFRGVSALPNSFAHDAFMDELAELTGMDPLAYRLRHLNDERAKDLLKAIADKAQWQSGEKGSRGVVNEQGLLTGRGVAYARYVHSKFPGFGAAWGAWIIDLTVNPETGEIKIDHIVVGQDNGMTVNPNGVKHQMHGNIIQSLSRTLKENVSFDGQGVSSLEWGSYPILHFSEVPPIDIVIMDRQNEPPLGAGESASVPSAAAIANALFDATGKRFRAPPFTPDKILDVLHQS